MHERAATPREPAGSGFGPDSRPARRLLGRRTPAPVAHFDRLSELATVLWSSGFGWLVAAMGLSACISLRCRVVCSSGVRSCPHHVAMDVPLPQRLVAVLERLGPTYIKVGQLLATRTDYLPAPYAEALRSLQDDATPFSALRARQIISTELGRPADELFADFDPVPLAAASLSQVHRARLRDGTPVAVKVQRPGVTDQVEADLALLAWLAGRLERRGAAALAFRPSAAVREITEYTRRELDFRNEARTGEAVARAFGPESEVVIPRVHWSLTTARVLTMDLVEGRRLAPRSELVSAGLDPDRILEAGARAMVRQIFDVGIFHADPHPGNLLVLPGNRICFLDFGLHGRLDRRQRRRMALLLSSLVNGDYEVTADQLLHLSERLPGADSRGFRSALAELVQSWYDDPSAPSVARLLLRELGLGSRFGIVFPRDLMLLARALLHLEASAAVVDPRLRFADLLGPVEADLRRSLVPGGADLEELWRTQWMDYLALILELPEVLPHLPDLLAERIAAAVGPVPGSAARPHPVRSAVTAGVAGLVGGILAGRTMGSGRRRAVRQR